MSLHCIEFFNLIEKDIVNILKIVQKMAASDSDDQRHHGPKIFLLDAGLHDDIGLLLYNLSHRQVQIGPSCISVILKAKEMETIANCLAIMTWVGPKSVVSTEPVRRMLIDHGFMVTS